MAPAPRRSLLGYRMRCFVLGIALASGCTNSATGSWIGRCLEEETEAEMDLFFQIEEKRGLFSGFAAATLNGVEHQGFAQGTHDDDVVFLVLTAAPLDLVISAYYKPDQMVGICTDEPTGFTGRAILAR
jgi:hypothetical protein